MRFQSARGVFTFVREGALVCACDQYSYCPCCRGRCLYFFFTDVLIQIILKKKLQNKNQDELAYARVLLRNTGITGAK